MASCSPTSRTRRWRGSCPAPRSSRSSRSPRTAARTGTRRCASRPRPSGSGPRAATAIVVDEVPTRADLEHAAAIVEQGGDAATLLVVPASRRPRAAGHVGWAGLTRAVVAAAGALATGRSTSVVPVVVPYPAGPGAAGWPVPALADVLAAYGATRVVRLADLRSPAERDRVAAIAGVHDAAVREVYPDASAAEVLRTRRGDRAPGRGGPVHRPLRVGQVDHRPVAGRGARGRRPAPASRSWTATRSASTCPRSWGSTSPRGSATSSGSAGSRRWSPGTGASRWPRRSRRSRCRGPASAPWPRPPAPPSSSCG